VKSEKNHIIQTLKTENKTQKNDASKNTRIKLHQSIDRISPFYDNLDE